MTTKKDVLTKLLKLILSSSFGPPQTMVDVIHIIQQTAALTIGRDGWLFDDTFAEMSLVVVCGGLFSDQVIGPEVHQVGLQVCWFWTQGELHASNSWSRLRRI